MKRDKLEYFKKLLENGKLGHTYLFWGEAGAEKFAFAKKLISLWDAKFLETAILEADKGGTIGIDKTRFAKQFLFQKPLYAPRRAVIINEMENLTDEAQNSLLKLAEEPPGTSLLIGIAVNPENLFTTLSSRFLKFYFGKVPHADGYNDNAVAFLKNKPARGKIIEKVLEDEKENEFFEGLLIILRRDIMTNWRLIKFVNERIGLMRRYQTNKKLQLQAIKEFVDKHGR
ncbi:hypothetical protein A3A20_01195 [Candidatus Wolfebacteria bacterium RIFCSPLOWO2_01_FULL_45_19]|uniref:DNA polymerase III delta N-terminal domain-containing protein n=1 Tax=Candidatus Wolfebacteria bacterium RIFCSPLOWO2_01_FULL_45_19 TaxID=1802557 RepID=A0A1F8DSD9_9BACT|nr:MAG: hypothetical protein UX23_C0004G0022 [Parcubacteria group bacterium GW2011_GWB1_45_9]OGM91547.1 MAG: hypothetical protein A3A20_01195 [Candidatus Wolfebacteria bacterium RIFCSPLOWO2_01_FULL_45_19]